jgi:hypothetical protein
MEEERVARFVAVTEEDLARARRDPAFRQDLLAENLGALIEELNRRQRAARDASPDQLREGAELAVKLADLINALDQSGKAGGVDSRRAKGSRPDRT